MGFFGVSAWGLGFRVSVCKSRKLYRGFFVFTLAVKGLGVWVEGFGVFGNRRRALGVHALYLARSPNPINCRGKVLAFIGLM